MPIDASLLDRAFDADAIISRVKSHLGIKSDKDFAELLNISQSTLSSWRSRQSIPLTYIIAIAQLLNVSTDWIFFGEPISINIEASKVDDLLIKSAFSAAISSEISDQNLNDKIVDRAMTYYSKLRSISTSLKKVEGLSKEQSIAIMDELIAAFADKMS